MTAIGWNIKELIMDMVTCPLGWDRIETNAILSCTMCYRNGMMTLHVWTCYHCRIP